MATVAERGRRKVRDGVVVSDKMDKTIVVAVETSHKHPLYKKIVRRTKRYKAHDGDNTCRSGDLVRIVESRPLSRFKSWRVQEVLQRAEQLEVTPEQIDAELLAEVEEAAAPVAPEAIAPAEPSEPAPVALPKAEAAVRRRAKKLEVKPEQIDAELPVEVEEAAVPVPPEAMAPAEPSEPAPVDLTQAEVAAVDTPDEEPAPPAEDIAEAEASAAEEDLDAAPALAEEAEPEAAEPAAADTSEDEARAEK